MLVSREDLANQNVPLHVRDYCAHVVIPLNKYYFLTFLLLLVSVVTILHYCFLFADVDERICGYLGPVNT